MRISDKELRIIKKASDYTLEETLSFLKSDSLTNKYGITWYPDLDACDTIEQLKKAYIEEIEAEILKRKG